MDESPLFLRALNQLNICIMKREYITISLHHGEKASDEVRRFCTNHGIRLQEREYQIGMRFTDGVTEYILSQVAPGQVALINLETGNRANDPVKVAVGAYAISHDEFCLIADRMDVGML